MRIGDVASSEVVVSPTVLVWLIIAVTVELMSVVIVSGTVNVVGNMDDDNVGPAVDNLVDVTWNVAVVARLEVLYRAVVVVMRASNVAALEVVVSLDILVSDAVLFCFVSGKVEIMTEVVVLGTVDIVAVLDAGNVDRAVDNVVDITRDVLVGFLVCVVSKRAVVVAMRAGDVVASIVVDSLIVLVSEAVLISLLAGKVELMSMVVNSGTVDVVENMDVDVLWGVTVGVEANVVL